MIDEGKSFKESDKLIITGALKEARQPEWATEEFLVDMRGTIVKGQVSDLVAKVGSNYPFCAPSAVAAAAAAKEGGGGGSQ